MALRAWTGGSASAREMVGPPHQPKTPSLCVSLEDDDAESGKQESDEPDTTDSEVRLLFSAIRLGSQVQEV